MNSSLNESSPNHFTEPDDGTNLIVDPNYDPFGDNDQAGDTLETPINTDIFQHQELNISSQEDLKKYTQTKISNYELYILSKAIKIHFNNLQVYKPQNKTPFDNPNNRSILFPFILALQNRELNYIDHTTMLGSLYEIYKYNINNRDNEGLQTIQLTAASLYQEDIPNPFSDFIEQTFSKETDNTPIPIPDISKNPNIQLTSPIAQIIKTPTYQTIANIRIHPATTNISIHMEAISASPHLPKLEDAIHKRIQRRLENTISEFDTEELLAYLIGLLEEVNNLVISKSTFKKLQNFFFGLKIHFLENNITILPEANTIEEYILKKLIDIATLSEKQNEVREKLTDYLEIDIQEHSKNQIRPTSNPQTPQPKVEREPSSQIQTQRIISGQTILLPTNPRYLDKFRDTTRSIGLNLNIQYPLSLELDCDPNFLNTFDQIFETLNPTNIRQSTVQLANQLSKQLRNKQIVFYNTSLQENYPEIVPLNQIIGKIILKHINSIQASTSQYSEINKLAKELHNHIKRLSPKFQNTTYEVAENIITLQHQLVDPHLGEVTIYIKLILPSNNQNHFDNIVDLLPYDQQEPQLTMVPYISMEIQGLEILIQNATVYNSKGLHDILTNL